MSAAMQAQPLSTASNGRWLAPLNHWPRAVLAALQREAAVVRVLVASARGSAPREAGACMLVGRDGLRGTIGGGYLEWEAQRAALAMLTSVDAPAVQVRKLILGAELGQCCGGVVELWLERFTAMDEAVLRQAATPNCYWRSSVKPDGQVERDVTRYPLSPRERGSGEGPSPQKRAHSEVARSPSSPTLLPSSEGRPALQLIRSDDGNCTLLEDLGGNTLPVHLYGAGHVGQALVPVLAGLPYAVRWIDARAELLPADVPDNVTPLCTAFPLQTLREAAPGTHYIVMTHDHALDYALCRAILERGDAAFVGVIGSHSKGARFRSRLARDGLSAAQIAPLVCPIGIAGIPSKLPAAIAVGIAAQLLQLTTEIRAELKTPLLETPLHPVETCSVDGCKACPQAERTARHLAKDASLQ
ncbi:xanthine dehydrogenase accessory protein XdhC [uncultured Nevskia sp.]|uniref:xanthine dehydrogenase accessory protein XdhC n=1 Tax=uncultured Nevskia sp. TaxID=228950 RepID=UPI0025FB4DED|nr:xanthine dehydrogenase accessory protein XdhC [uncultured Nevskia sp.]